MIQQCPSDAVQNWKKAYPCRDKSYFFSTTDAEHTALSTSQFNTIGWEEADDAAENYTMKLVCDLLGSHVSAGAVFGDSSEKAMLLFSRRIGLIEMTSVTVSKLDHEAYVHKGIPATYRKMPIQAFVIEPTIGELVRIFGSRVKLAIGEYADNFTQYIK